MLIKLKGILDFDIEDITQKHKKQSSWKRVAMIKTNCEMDRYYAWFLNKRFNLELNKNIRGSHITIISDKLDRNVFENAKEIFNGKEIEFYLDLEPRANTNGHWWLRAYSPTAESIREAMGLTRDPYFAFHMTIGLANSKNIDHSNYILRQCQRFELITNEKRSKLDEQEIIEFNT